MPRRASPSSIAAVVSPRIGSGSRARRGGIEAARPYESTLPEAENTLKRLRERQIEAQAASDALIELDAATGPLATAEKLAEQGFGPAEINRG